MLWFSQEKYVTNVLQRFNMHNTKPVGSTLPMNCKLNSSQCPRGGNDKAEMRRVSYTSIVRSLVYVMVCSRPDTAFVVESISRYMTNPRKEHWTTVKWILRYVKGTLSVCLSNGSGKPITRLRSQVEGKCIPLVDTS